MQRCCEPVGYCRIEVTHLGVENHLSSAYPGGRKWGLLPQTFEAFSRLASAALLKKVTPCAQTESPVSTRVPTLTGTPLARSNRRGDGFWPGGNYFPPGPPFLKRRLVFFGGGKTNNIF